MLWKETTDDHLFVYWNGELIYKTWRQWGQSVVLNTYGANSSNGDVYWNADERLRHKVWEMEGWAK